MFDFLKTCSPLSQFVHKLFKTCFVHDLSLITCFGLSHDFFASCSWFARDLSMTCSQLVHNLFMTCSFDYYFFMTCSLFFSLLVHEFFTTCFIFLNLFKTCFVLVHSFSLFFHDWFTTCLWLLRNFFKKKIHNLFIWGQLLHGLFTIDSKLVFGISVTNVGIWHYFWKDRRKGDLSTSFWA